MKFVMQFIDLHSRLLQPFPALRCDPVHPAPASANVFKSGSEVSSTLQTVQKRIKRARAYAISVVLQLLDHCQPENGLMRRVDQHMDTYEADKELPLMEGHNKRIPVQIKSCYRISML